MIEGIDYDETYAPTISFVAIMITLHIAVTKRWDVTGLDVGNAYLEALTNRELFMSLPKDWTNKETVIVRLLKNLYGTKQAALLWFEKIKHVLETFGFKSLKTEPCCFQYSETNNTAIICVYVDDLLIVGNNADTTNSIKAYLSKQFKKIKDLGSLNKYLGIEMKKTEGGYTLSQEQYIEDIIKEFNVTSEKETPLPFNYEQLLINKEEDNTTTKHKEGLNMLDFVGKIRFLADRIRPDLAYAASTIARFANNPTQQQTRIIPRISQYLLHSKKENLSIGSKSQEEIKLFGFADASFIRGGDSKAQLGYCFFLSRDCGAIYHKSHRDKSVSISSTHAEINALVEATKTTMWIREFLAELKLYQREPTIIYQNNTNVLHITETIGNEQKTKYLINKINFVRENIKEEIIQLRYIPTNKNLADIFTKALQKEQFKYLHNKILHGLNTGNDDEERIDTNNSELLQLNNETKPTETG